jgi:hypothetical protein
VTASVSAALAQNEAEETDQDKALAEQRLELMREHVLGFEVSSDVEGFPESFDDAHIFRYDDPARGYVDAAVWRLGSEGRPRALVTTELHPRFFNRPRIVFEYLSLSDERYAVGSWAPATSALQFQKIPDAPAPAETKRARTLQLGRLADRFAASEFAENEPAELRLLPNAVLRYTPGSEAGSDGAIYFFVYGTNPEAALLIESDGSGWTFAVGRLSGAAKMTVTLDDKQVWEVGPATYQSNEPYTASNRGVSIPGIAPDGSPIEP